jgi:hypothetical protein
LGNLQKINIQSYQNSNTITFNQILNKDNSVNTIVDHQEISRNIAECNTQHFQQALQTPFSTMSYKSIVDHSKKFSEPTWIKKVDLKTNQPEIKRITYKLLENLIEPPKEVGNSTKSKDKWKQKIKKLKEKTTTPPSGLHLGHYKTLISPHQYTYDSGTQKKRI